jgi:hypothetical protein
MNNARPCLKRIGGKANARKNLDPALEDRKRDFGVWSQVSAEEWIDTHYSSGTHRVPAVTASGSKGGVLRTKEEA